LSCPAAQKCEAFIFRVHWRQRGLGLLRDWGFFAAPKEPRNHFFHLKNFLSTKKVRKTKVTFLLHETAEPLVKIVRLRYFI
jgi:hypothetical protein